MAYQIYLSKNPKQAADDVKFLISEGKQKQAPKAIRWWIAMRYMQGARKFDMLNFKTGSIRIGFSDERGRLAFNFEGILPLYQNQLGRLQGLNLSPHVLTKGTSLSGVQKMSVAQATLDEIFPPVKVSKLQEDLYPPLLHYGTIGLMPWFESADSMGVEIVPPWELIPLPVDVGTSAEVRGLIRCRYVPLDWVKGLVVTPSKRSEVYNKIDSMKVPVGQMPSRTDDKYMGAMLSGGFNTSSGSKTKGEMMDITEFIEVWTMTPDNYLAEQRMYAGIKEYTEIFKTDYTGRPGRVHFPLQIIRDIHIGGFYGRGFVESLIPMNQETEKAIAKTFQNLRDEDLYGLVMFPATSGMPKQAFKARDGMKMGMFEADHFTPGHPLVPMQFKPVSSMQSAPKVLDVGVGLLRLLANQPTELLKGEAPGRVDSSTALGTLFETGQIPLKPVAGSIAMGIAGCYRVLLQLAKESWSSGKVLEVSQLDDHIAGVKFDPMTGAIDLEKNPIPHPDEVNIKIASEAPVSRSQQIMELKEERDKGQITPIQYGIEVRKRGLDLPVANELEWQNYRRAMLENIIMFGDGKEPGSVLLDDKDVPIVHLMVHKPFAARPECYASSSEVMNKLTEHITQHELQMGKFPEQMPYPEDMAAQLLQPQQGMPPQQ